MKNSGAIVQVPLKQPHRILVFFARFETVET